jgi:hypothetical protein
MSNLPIKLKKQMDSVLTAFNLEVGMWDISYGS